jgi:hypothetical protein
MGLQYVLQSGYAFALQSFVFITTLGVGGVQVAREFGAAFSAAHRRRRCHCGGFVPAARRLDTATGG